MARTRNYAVISGSKMPLERERERRLTEHNVSRLTPGGGSASTKSAWPQAGVESQYGNASGTSIFDPTLCELVYRWFCPPGGSVLDPFAGGSVRGILAAKCGLRYTGIDLSARQIEANNEQATAISPDARPVWIVGNSLNVNALAPGEYDLIFSCPPYYDLEIYSDEPGDISAAKSYDDFLATYRVIIANAVSMLKPNRFAVFVVGDIRDKAGFYRKFPWHTIEAFEASGMRLYNEAVLVRVWGSSDRE